ncbi:uncharacterized protein ISCGN_003603 [Ixodes scapularis]
MSRVLVHFTDDNTYEVVRKEDIRGKRSLVTTGDRVKVNWRGMGLYGAVVVNVSDNEHDLSQEMNDLIATKNKATVHRKRTPSVHVMQAQDLFKEIMDEGTIDALKLEILVLRKENKQLKRELRKRRTAEEYLERAEKILKAAAPFQTLCIAQGEDINFNGNGIIILNEPGTGTESSQVVRFNEDPELLDEPQPDRPNDMPLRQEPEGVPQEPEELEDVPQDPPQDYRSPEHPPQEYLLEEHSPKQHPPQQHPPQCQFRRKKQDNMVKDNILKEFSDTDDTAIVADGDVLRLVENPFQEVTAEQPLQTSVPGHEISHDSTASHPGPALIEPTPGPSGYKFHDFPVNICQEIAETKEGLVSGTLRAKIVKHIVSALCVNTMYPCEHYLAAAKDLVRRYPQLKDKSRTHCVSWHASIKNRARNIRKRMPAGVNEVDARKAEAKAHRERRAALPCNQQCRPKNAVRNVFPAASCGTGEDEAAVQGQVDLMKKEMKKTVWDQKKVQDAMNRTYKTRRAWLNKENLTVAAVTDRYPALALTQEIQLEFRRQTGRDAQEGLTAFLERSTKALYKLFCMKSSSKQKAKQILEAAENCPEEGETLLANGALILLPCLLKERSDNLVKSLEPGTQYINPSIVYTAPSSSADPVQLVREDAASVFKSKSSFVPFQNVEDSRRIPSEAWRQIRFFKDCIHEACHREAPFDQATRRVQRELQTASRITEVQWLQILATLPKKRECRSPEGQAVHVIGNTDVPDKARRVLCLGPKFCNQPELSKPELLSMVRSTAARADAENVEGVIRDGVDCLRRSSKCTSSIRTEDTISALREANLKLLLSDKEGGFAIVPDDIYNQKAAEAITSNFTLLKSYKPEKTRKEAVKMCERLNLTKLASSVRNCKGLSLEAFFSAKTHKMACPFRVIVSERGTWQCLLGHYLQKSLFVLEVEDPYLVRTPSMVSDYLQQLPKGKVLAFSVDIKDLYYSLPHDSICEIVNDGIDRYGPLKFQNSVGIAAEDFLNLLMLYLRSTTVVFRSEFYRQREGVCIGSRIAPALSDLLLAFYDRLLEISLRDSSVIKIFRYVDDFLVLYRPSDDTGSKDVWLLRESFLLEPPTGSDSLGWNPSAHSPCEDPSSLQHSARPRLEHQKSHH